MSCSFVFSYVFISIPQNTKISCCNSRGKCFFLDFQTLVHGTQHIKRAAARRPSKKKHGDRPDEERYADAPQEA